MTGKLVGINSDKKAAKFAFWGITSRMSDPTFYEEYAKELVKFGDCEDLFEAVKKNKSKISSKIYTAGDGIQEMNKDVVGSFKYDYLYNYTYNNLYEFVKGNKRLLVECGSGLPVVSLKCY